MVRRPPARQAVRLVVVAGILIFIVFAALVSRLYYSNKKDVGLVAQSSEHPSIAASAPDTKDPNADGDNDKLADWQELLWGTDVNNPDSDGDGATDGEEVAAGEDPMKAGKDSLAFAVASGTSDTATPQTATQAVAQELIGSYLASLQQGQTLSEEAQGQLVDQAILAAQPQLELPRFSATEARVVPATDTSRQAYSDQMRNEMRLMIEGSSNEMSALLELAQGDRQKAERALADTVKVYGARIEKMKTIAAPTDALLLHVTFINALLQYNWTLEGFSLLDADPIRATVAANTFTLQQDQLSRAMGMLRAYLDAHGVSIDPVTVTPKASS